MPINATINGKGHEFQAELNGLQLLEHFEIAPATVVIELNGEIIKREDFLVRPVEDGDAIELVTLVGGG